MIGIIQGFSGVHFTRCSPTQSILRKSMLAVQDSMPLRLHRVHFLHAPAVIESILNIFYPLLKAKLVQKVGEIDERDCARWMVLLFLILRVPSYSSFAYIPAVGRSCTPIWARIYCRTSGEAELAPSTSSMVRETESLCYVWRFLAFWRLAVIDMQATIII